MLSNRTSSVMAKLGPGLGTLLWAFINSTWTKPWQKDFWSPFGFVHSWCNHQKYTNPRLSAFMIELQYHFLPLKYGLRSDKRHDLLNQCLPYICCMFWWHKVVIRLHFPCLVSIALHFLSAQHSQHCYQSLLHCCSIESVQSDHLM